MDVIGHSKRKPDEKTVKRHHVNNPKRVQYYYYIIWESSLIIRYPSPGTRDKFPVFALHSFRHHYPFPENFHTSLLAVER